MAEKLESYEFLDTGKNWRKYPWDDWCDGSIWKIVCGEDYTVPPKSMRCQLCTRAKTIGMKVRTNQIQTNRRVLVFQFYNEEDD